MLARRLLLVAVVVITMPLVGQQHPNVERGFQADRVYQFNGIDDVNLYNGNLSLTIAIGNEYPGNGALKYRLALTYNSKAWDQEIHLYEEFDDCWRPPGSQIPPHVWCNKPFIKTVPSRRSNAGMGWSLSLGRLISPSDPIVIPGPAGSGMPFWVYEGPDGADHSFSMTDPTNSSISHTRDGSFLRLVPLVADRWEVHFPDGAIHTFAPAAGAYSPRLEEIRDPFGNHLKVLYGAGGNWTLREYTSTGTQVREHYVRFRDITVGPEAPLNAPPNYDFVLDEVDLAAFGGARAVYSFEYTTDEIQYGCYGDWRNTETPNPKVPRLQEILFPDQSKWEADYFNWGCSSIQALVLPTKGRMEWTYMTYLMPTAGCKTWEVPDTDSANSPFSEVEGVETKKVISTDGAESLWTYGQNWELLSPHVVSCPTSLGGQLVPKYQQSKVTVTSPDGSKTENFFSIWDDAASPPDVVFDRSEYGLPFTRGPNSGCLSDPAALCLSSIQYDCSLGPCEPARSRYVRYEGESRYSAVGYEEFGYRREVANRTVFHEDGDRFVHTLRSRYDGLGHFRTVTSSDSWSGLSRGETTNYNPTKPDVTVNSITWVNSPANNRPTPNERWLLNLFDSTTVSEAGQSATSQFCFDAVTGFLTKRRVMKGTSPGLNDLFHLFSSDSNGNVSREEYFGGDRQILSLASLCTVSPPAHDSSSFRVDHTYQHGSLASSTYWDPMTQALMSFMSVDNTIDSNTGIVSLSRDPAGVPTSYSYDLLGRLTALTPTGVAPTTYTYTNATQTTPAQVEIAQVSATPANGAIRSQFQFDSLGRVWRNKKLMPDGSWSTRETRYNAMGWRDRVSELEATPTHFTIFSNYDPFGRVGTVTSPDDKATTMTYFGARVVTRTRGVGTAPGVETPATTTENYDGHGRLSSVVEHGGASTTIYTYDVGNRLTSTSMTAGGTTQPRTFTYDRRGFLQSETHPEAGTTSYGDYDARGHPGSRSVNGANDIFDLKFTYDAAERLVKVESRTPYDPNAFRVSKQFLFGSTNDGSNLKRGKLEKAKRHNYGMPTGVLGDYTVSETFEYRDAAGHMTLKSTDLTDDDAGYGPGSLRQRTTETFAYNDLGMVSSAEYPVCEIVDCGEAAWPTLEMNYVSGALTSIPNFAYAIGYAPNGMVQTVERWNGVIDTQTPDANAMPRPESISFANVAECAAPIITVHPASQTVTYGSPASLSVGATGSGSPTYQWFEVGDPDPIPEAGLPTYVTPPLTQTTSYLVSVINSCGRADSNPATVTVAPAAPSNLVATMVSETQIAVSWTVSQGADHYELWRKSNGNFVKIADVAGTSHLDGPVNVGSYVYRVRAASAGGTAFSGYSNSDLATTMTFSPIVSGETTVISAHFEELRSALNAVRWASGLPPLSWVDILPGGLPAPAPEVVIYGVHVTSLRSKMDEALDALELPTGSYSDPVLDNSILIKRLHVLELRVRTQ